MKVWAMTILMLAGKLDELADALDGRITRLALDLSADTLKQYEKILELNEVKRRIANLSVLASRMLDRLTEEERRMVRAYASGASMRDIAGDEGIGKSGVSRKINAALYKCVRVLCGLSFTQERLERDYSSIALVSRTRARLIRARLGGDAGGNASSAASGSEPPEPATERRPSRAERSLSFPVCAGTAGA